MLAHYSEVAQSRRNLQFLELLEELQETPEALRTKPAYSAKLLRLRELTTEEMYRLVVTTYQL